MEEKTQFEPGQRFVFLKYEKDENGKKVRKGIPAEFLSESENCIVGKTDDGQTIGLSKEEDTFALTEADCWNQLAKTTNDKVQDLFKRFAGSLSITNFHYLVAIEAYYQVLTQELLYRLTQILRDKE